MDTQKIQELNAKGLSDRQIGKLLNCSHKTIGYHRHKMGLKSPTDLRYQAEFVDEFSIKCRKCNKVLPSDQFQKGRVGTPREYTFSYCNSCRNLHTKSRRSRNLDLFLKERHSNLKRRAAAQSTYFNLTLVDFIEIYHSQDGKCFYTGAELHVKAGEGRKENSLSVDRVNNKLGYTRENVVFCTSRINTVKSNLTLEEIKEYMPKWYKKIEKFIAK